MARIEPIKLTKAGYQALAEALRPIEPWTERSKAVQRLLPHLYAGNRKFSAILFSKQANCTNLIFDGDTDEYPPE